MELAKMIKKINNKQKAVLLAGLLGLTAGLVFSMLPVKFVASGTFYVTRGEDDKKPSGTFGKEFFDYQGYYGQQTAQAYTNNVLALLESGDVQSKALKKMGIEINEKNMRAFNRQVQVKKAGPQLVTMLIKNSSFENAEISWNALAESLQESAREMNANGDNMLKIVKVSEEPVIKKAFSSPAAYMLIGLLAGLTISSGYIIMKEYLK